MKNIKIIIITVIAWVTVLAVNSIHAQKVINKQPNVIVVLTDDQGYGELSIHGNTKLASVSVNGEVTKSKTNERGFVELNRNWKKGDLVAIDYEYELKATIQDGEKGKKWVAFSYGPIALAQKIDSMPGDEPFLNIDFTNPNELLNQLNKSATSDIEFNIKGTKVSLIPYYQTGTKKSGPKTYFILNN